MTLTELKALAFDLQNNVQFVMSLIKQKGIETPPQEEPKAKE